MPLPRRFSLPLLLSLVGCWTGHQAAPATTANPATPCATRGHLLSPAAGYAGRVERTAAGTGWAIAWSEHVGSGDVLRLLLVDGAGVGIAPVADIVKRTAPLRLRSLGRDIDSDGYVLGWTEGGRDRLLRLDARFRPRGEATDDDTIGLGGLRPSRCTTDAPATRCTTSRGIDLVVPPGAAVVSSELGTGGDLVLAVDAAGLQLYALDCSPHASP